MEDIYSWLSFSCYMIVKEKLLCLKRNLSSKSIRKCYRSRGKREETQGEGGNEGGDRREDDQVDNI